MNNSNYFYQNQPDAFQEYASYNPNPNLALMSSISKLEKDIRCMFEPDYVGKDFDNEVDESYAEDDYKKPTMDPTKLLVNNIKGTGKVEYLEEHIVVVDSSDRNIEKYPNPFLYRVYFNSQYDDANIQRKFENVKSIKLDAGVLPSRYFFTKKDISFTIDNEFIIKKLSSDKRNSVFNLTSTLIKEFPVDTNYIVIDVVDIILNNKGTRKIKFCKETEYPLIIDYVFEYVIKYDCINNNVPDNILNSNTILPQTIQQYKLESYVLERNKFSLLYIDEFSSVNRYSTNDELAKSFAVLFVDSKCNHSHYVSSKLKEKEFKLGNLGSVNRLTISLRDYNGEQLKCTTDASYFDNDIPKYKSCTCTVDNNGVFNRDYRCSCTYFRNPLYHHFQNTLMFKITTYECDISREIFN